MIYIADSFSNIDSSQYIYIHIYVCVCVYIYIYIYIYIYYLRDFPDGSVIKNPPANAGDMGSNPGPGTSYISWIN